jgi:hypothetical protein
MREGLRCLAILTCGCVALPAMAASPPSAAAVRLGDGSADGTRLKPYDNAWLYAVRFPDGHVKAQGIWSDHVEAVTVDGRAALKRVQGMTYVNALSSSGITVMDASTCAPISSEQHRPDGLIIKRTFKGARVATERIEHAGDEPSRSVVDLPVPVFDFYGGAYGFLLSCFPLKVGYSATFPAIGETIDTLAPVTFSVVRRETVSAGSRGRVDAFVVIADKPDEYKQTFWLSTTAPYIIRLEIDYPAAPYVVSFDMI